MPTAVGSSVWIRARVTAAPAATSTTPDRAQLEDRARSAWPSRRRSPAERPGMSTVDAMAAGQTGALGRYSRPRVPSFTGGTDGVTFAPGVTGSDWADG